MTAAKLAEARLKAVRLLLSSRLYGLKTDVTRLKYHKTIIFETYSNFCLNSTATLEDFTISDNLKDGCTVLRETEGSAIYVVLYNDKIKSQARRRFTLAHEVGHIILEHERDDRLQEAEANRFAAELIIPGILVRELQKRTSFKITAHEIAEIFGVSLAASETQIASLASAHDFTDDEKYLLKKVEGFLPDFSGPVVDS